MILTYSIWCRNKTESNIYWKVDTASKDKVLTVTSDGATEQQVIDIVKQAGFKIEAINS